MTMTIEIPDRRRYEQAAEWLLKVQAEGAPPEVFAEMLEWCDADPLNKVAMERIEEVWAVTGEVELDPGQLPRVEAPGVTTWRQWIREHFGRSGGFVAAGAVAAAVMAIGMVVGLGDRSGTVGERVATARGAHEQATLPDGSQVELGGKSSMSVVFSPQNRVVVAEDGEAFYRVSKDPDRPFIVRAGPVTVTAVGTAFTVRRSGESVSVVVTEGIVDVSTDKRAVRAEAGQRVRYDQGALAPTAEPVSPEVATSWREGRLQFVDEPLRLVIASLNRYSDREVLISGAAVEELRFTGTIFDNGVDNWLRGVAAVFPVRIVPIDQRRVMIAPAS